MNDESLQSPGIPGIEALVQRMATGKGQALATLGAVQMHVMNPLGAPSPSDNTTERLNALDAKLFETAVAAKAQAEGVSPEKARQALKETWQGVRLNANDDLSDEWMRKYQTNMETTADLLAKLPDKNRQRALADITDAFIPGAAEERQRAAEQAMEPKPMSTPAKSQATGVGPAR